jgi:hypothetical protein
MPVTREIPILERAMRKLLVLACSLAVAAVLTVSAGAADPTTGVLSIDQGRGAVTLDVRGVVLGRLGNGSIRVTDHTPRDPFTEIVRGKYLEERVGPRTVVYRGQGLRFRMVGGRFRIVIRGSGITVSANARGFVTLDGERRSFDEVTGLYSLTGADCSLEPELCTVIPDDPERFPLGGPVEEGDVRGG